MTRCRAILSLPLSLLWLFAVAHCLLENMHHHSVPTLESGLGSKLARQESLPHVPNQPHEHRHHHHHHHSDSHAAHELPSTSPVHGSHDDSDSHNCELKMVTHFEGLYKTGKIVTVSHLEKKFLSPPAYGSKLNPIKIKFPDNGADPPYLAQLWIIEAQGPNSPPLSS